MLKKTLVFVFFLFLLHGAFALSCSWTEIADMSGKSINKIVVAPSGEVYALEQREGGKFYLHKSSDGGESWQEIYSFHQYILDKFNEFYSGHELIATSLNHIYSVGRNLANGIVVFYSTDSGATWNSTKNIGDVGITELLEANGKLFAAANDASVYKKSQSTSVVIWTPLTPISGQYMDIQILQLSSGEIYHAIYGPVFAWKRIYKTSDEGISWEVVGDIPAALEQGSIMELSNGALLYTGRVEAGGMSYNAVIYKSINSGTTWNLLKTFGEGEYSISAIVLAGDGTLYVGSYGSGKFYKSTNNGETWEEITHPTGSSIIKPFTETVPGKLLIGGQQGLWKYECVSTAPVANAGPDQMGYTSTTIQLDGSASSDADGDMLNFSWAQISGSTVTLFGGNTATPSFNAPPTTGILEFRLTVSDSTLTATDTVAITISIAPECVEGTTQSCLTAASCSGTQTCAASVWGSCEVTEICTPASTRSCVSIINGVECSAISGTQTCNECGTAYAECVSPVIAECCPAAVDECIVDGCIGTMVCNEAGSWNLCIKEDPSCEGPEEPSDGAPSEECESNADCAANEICITQICETLECPEGEVVENHECVRAAEEIVIATMEEAREALGNALNLINEGNVEEARHILFAVKTGLSSSPNYGTVEPLLNQALGELASNDLEKAKNTIENIKNLLETKPIDYTWIIIAAIIIVVLGGIANILYWKYKGKKEKVKPAQIKL